MASPGVGLPDPCLEALGWRVAAVDPRFGIGPDEVESAMAAAASLWEAAAGRPLFFHDPQGGFPVRLVFDQRQAFTQERMRVEEEFRALDAELDALGRAWDAAMRREAAARDEYAVRVLALQEELSFHNQEVARLNRAGGAPSQVATELEARAEALRLRGEALGAEADELDVRDRALRLEGEELVRRVSTRNREARAMQGRFPETEVEAGAYRELGRDGPDGAMVLSREIRVFRFDDRSDLIRVLAHELGHALGLGHVSVPGAIMSEEYGREGQPGEPRVTADDLRLLLERCEGP